MLMRILILFFLLIPLLSAADEPASLVNLGGTVRSMAGDCLAGMRVEALVRAVSADPTGNGTAEYWLKVGYTDGKGRFLLNLPVATTLRITASGPGYAALTQNLNLQTGTNLADYPVTLKANLAGIEPGSREQAELYVSLVHRQAIDKLLEGRKFEGIQEFLESQLIDGRERTWAYRLTGFLLLDYGLPETARLFFEKGLSGWFCNFQAEKRMQTGDLAGAIEAYSRGDPVWERTMNLYRCAERLHVQGESALRDRALKLAEHSYKQALTSYYLEPFLLLPGMMGRLIDMERIERVFYDRIDPNVQALLERAGRYCTMMEKKSYLYTCRESKTDRILTSSMLSRAENDPSAHFDGRPLPDFSFVPVELEERYDIQLVVMDDGKIEENRRLLYKTQGVRFEGQRLNSIDIHKAHFGPNSIVGPDVQAFYIYHLAGEEDCLDQAAWIVEAIPRWRACSDLNPGRIWISKKDGSVLKIERSYQLDKDRDQIRLRGLILGLQPRLTFISEFAFAKDGIRYPSRIEVRESYLDGEREKLVRLVIESRFSDYQFFGVSSEVTVTKDPQ